VKTLRLFLVAALAAAFLSPLEHSTAQAQVSIYDPSVRTADQLIQRRGLAKIGSVLGSPANAAWYFDEFNGSVLGNAIAPNWRSTVVSTGAGSFGLVDEAGGVHQLTTGATASSSIIHNTDSPFTRSGGANVWYFAVRQKVTTAVTAQTMLYTGLQNLAATKTFGAGVFGANSAVNFTFQYDGNETGTFVSSGVAIDTAYHISEMWCRGDNKIHCSFDLGSADLCAGATMSAAATDSHAGIRVARNGTDAVARSVRIDYFAILAKRN